MFSAKQKLGTGGVKTRADIQKVNKPKTEHGKMAFFKEGGSTMAKSSAITKAKMGTVRTAAPSKDGVASKGKTKGTMVSMKSSTPLGMKKGGYCGGGMSYGKKK